MRRKNVSLQFVYDNLVNQLITSFEVKRCADSKIHLKIEFWNRDKFRHEILYTDKYEASLMLPFVRQLASKVPTLEKYPDGIHFSNLPF